jgi:DNA-binding transcriptional MerR regulator
VIDPGAASKASALDDSAFPGFAIGAAADALGVTPAFLRSAEAAGLFEAHRSTGGHRRYSREDLQRADRTRRLLDEGVRMDAAVRIVSLEFQLAAAEAMIVLLRGGPSKRSTPQRHRDAT